MPSQPSRNLPGHLKGEEGFGGRFLESQKKEKLVREGGRIRLGPELGSGAKDAKKGKRTFSSTACEKGSPK